MSSEKSLASWGRIEPELTRAAEKTRNMNKPPKPSVPVKTKTKQQDEATKKSRSPSVHKKPGATSAPETLSKTTTVSKKTPSQKTSSSRPTEATKTRSDTSRSRERPREVKKSENAKQKDRATDASSKAPAATKVASSSSSRTSTSTVRPKVTLKEQSSGHSPSIKETSKKPERLKSSRATRDTGAPQKERDQSEASLPVPAVTKNERHERPSERLKSSRGTRDGGMGQREKNKTDAPSAVTTVSKHKADDVQQVKTSKHKEEKKEKFKDEEQKKRNDKQHAQSTGGDIAIQSITATVPSSSRPRTAKASELRARTEKAQKAPEVEEVTDSRPSTARQPRRQNTFNLKDQEIQDSVLNSQTSGETTEKSKFDPDVHEAAAAEKTSAVDVDYDDDFEDYESDFEDDEETTEVSKVSDDVTSTSVSRESHLNQVEEPKKESKDTSVLWKSEPSLEEPKKKDMKSSFSAYSLYNFASAKKEEDKKKELSKTQQRAKDILELVALDYVSISVFDLPPSSYDIYMKTFGRANTKQEITQTDNICEEECQTEDIDVIEKWTQLPPHDYKNLGCGTSVDNRKSGNLEEDPDLHDFLHAAVPLMLHVIEEDVAAENQKSLQPCPPEVTFCRGKVVLDASFILENGRVKDMCISPLSQNMLMTLHQPAGEDLGGDSALLDNGILCIWNLNKPLEPEEVLLSNALPTCCGWSSVGMGAVVAGMADGSVAIWDLQGKYSLHKSLIVTSRLPHREWQLKLPSYSTASVLGEDNHFSQIVSVQSPAQNSSYSKRDRLSEGFLESTQSFIVLSLDEDGMIIVWTAVETSSDPAGPEDDLGIAPFGRWKLVRSTVIQLQKILPMEAACMDILRTFHMEVSPIQRTHLFVATNLGLVLHSARHGGRVSPKFYKSRVEETFAQANCIAFSPHNLPYFLVGCSDGRLRLHSTAYEISLKEWQSPNNGAVESAQWSPSDPAKFFSSNGHSLVLWDVFSALPVATIHWKGPRILCLKTSGGPTAGTSDSYMVIATDNGEVATYYFAEPYLIADDVQYQKRREAMLKL